MIEQPNHANETRTVRMQHDVPEFLLAPYMKKSDALGRSLDPAYQSFGKSNWSIESWGTENVTDLIDAESAKYITTPILQSSGPS
jgi:hypothetical protein